MAIRKKKQKSMDEILSQAAQLVSGTIDPYKMGLNSEQVDVEQFIGHFKTKAAEMMVTQDVLNIAIGSYVNKFNPGVYSNDMRIILDYIEDKMQIKFHFYSGLLISLNKSEIHFVWSPDKSPC